MITTTKMHDLDGWLKTAAPIHFIGVGGSGMRPLAEFTASFDVKVSGSDRVSLLSETRFKFAVEGTPAEIGLLRDAKTIVYSSAISSSHPSFLLAKSQSAHVLHRSELLAKFTRYYRTISIAGTHGKTTTSALICHGLNELGADPSWIIGAPFSNGQPAWRRGKSDLLVIEADESDGSFLRYANFISVLNNIEPDHMDHYLTVDRLEQAFRDFIANTSSDGGVVLLGDESNTVNATRDYSGRKISFGLTEHCDMHLLSSAPMGLRTRARFTFEQSSYDLEIPLTGQHNLLNSLAAASVGTILGFSPKNIAGVLTTFPGVQRRLQRYVTKSNLLVFDDYAHNPGKISSCLAGVRSAFPGRRIFAVFQPHRYSRISALYHDFITAFAGENILVIVLPVYSAGEETLAGFEPDRLAAAIGQASNVKTFSAITLKDASDLIKSLIDPDFDVVVTIGAGDVWRIAESLSLD